MSVRGIVNDPTCGKPKEEKVVSLRSLRSMWLKGSEFFNAKPAEYAEETCFLESI
jgi:hypothetical protein